MASRLNPYISYDGNAREAIEFYAEVFGGKLEISTFGEAGAAQGPMEGMGDKVMHGMLDTDAGYTIMVSDNPPHWEHKPGTNISVSISGDDSDALRGYWDKLAASGTVLQPLERQMWGDDFGMLTDKFGINWMVNILGEQDK